VAEPGASQKRFQDGSLRSRLRPLAIGRQSVANAEIDLQTTRRTLPVKNPTNPTSDDRKYCD